MDQFKDWNFNLVNQDNPFPIQTEFPVNSNKIKPSLDQSSNSAQFLEKKEAKSDLIMAKPKTRKVLDLKNKRLVIELSNMGLSHQAIADKFAVGRSTVTKILLNKKQILDESLELYDDSRKRIRKGQFDKMEIELAKFCMATNLEPIPILKGEELPSFNTEEEEEENENNSKVDDKTNDINKVKVRSDLTRQMILDRAKELANQMGMTKFQPNKSWFFRFKRKFRLQFPANGYSKAQESFSDPASSTSFLTKNSIDLNFGQEQMLSSNFPTQYNFSHNDYRLATNNPASNENDAYSFPDIQINSLCHSTDVSPYLPNQPTFEPIMIDVPNHYNPTHLSPQLSGQGCFDYSHNNGRRLSGATSSFNPHYSNHQSHFNQQQQQQYHPSNPQILITNYNQSMQPYFPQQYNNDPTIKYNTSPLLNRNNHFQPPNLGMTNHINNHHVSHSIKVEENSNQSRPTHQQHYRNSSDPTYQDSIIGFPYSM